MRTLGIALASLLVTSAVGQAATKQFVQNGGFEIVNPAATNSSGNFEFGASYAPNSGPNVVTGWVSPTKSAYNLIFNPGNAFTPAGNAKGNFDYTGKEYLNGGASGKASPNGGKFAAIDGDPKYSGPIQQQINGLVKGAVYTLNFDWAAAQVASRSGATTDYIMASFGSSVYDTKTFNLPSAGFSGWMKESTQFVATGTSELLSFLDKGTPAGLPPIALLDGVTLTGLAGGTPVPEPAAIAILGLGLAGLGAARLRRR